MWYNKRETKTNTHTRIMSKQYNVAIVGLGGMGNWHREKIAEIENIKVKGSFDINPERQKFAVEKGLLAYDSFEAVLADPEIDIVTCATPNDSHKEIIIRALRAGKCAITEKPATLCSADLAEMDAVAKETGNLFTVHQNRRWDEDFLTVKRLFDTRELGEVFHLESRVHGSRGLPGGWRSLPEQGGGMVLDWGVHLFDQLLMMVPGKIKRVHATCTHITNELVDDGFTAHLEFENGVTALVDVSGNNFIFRSLPRWLVFGRDGTATLELWSKNGTMTRITNWDKKDAIPIRTAAGLTKTMAPRTDDTIKTDPLVYETPDVRDFYRNIMSTLEGKTEPAVKIPEVARVMRLMEAVFESDRKRQVVEFE
ncbi:MAG: Gfo/Idh/MocA family oxidoreductase [Kiritimatiellaeota bacterium]|nr:Gfo/Idh/MocA family oxidoreductase [Kiritimatiellota bacterium]